MADPSKPDRIPPTVDALLFKLATAKEPQQVERFLTLLAKTAWQLQEVTPTLEKLSRVTPHGPELTLQFVTEFSEPLPGDSAQIVVPFLKDSPLPVSLRLAAAGKLLDAQPTDRRFTHMVVDALTAGLGRTAHLERLLQLQSHTEQSPALDELVQRLEAEHLLKCPKCPAQLPRGELIKHLWGKHRLLYSDGKAAEPRHELDQVISVAAVAEDPAALDEAFLYSRLYYPQAERRLVFQSLAVRGFPDPTQTNRLMTLAEEQDSGLCPNCLSAVLDPIPELPPPASLASGRLTAEGYFIEVTDTGMGRVARVARPDNSAEVLAPRGPRTAPRLTAVLVALPLFLLAAIGVLLIPTRYSQPLLVATWLILLAWIGYALIRWLTKPLPDPSALAIDYAWSDLVPSIPLSQSTTRVLIRICRASIREGNHTERSEVLGELIEETARRVDRGAGYPQLLAASRVLQVLDGAQLGREKINGLVELFEPYLRGELSVSYAEAAAEVLLSGDTLSTGDTNRLGVCLIGSTFNAGLSPADLLAIGRFGPQFRQLLLDASPGHLGQLYALWKSRHSQPWHPIGEALTVFELARDVPNAARKILADFPDTLLRIQVLESIEEQIGPILLTTRGLSVGGKLLSDPDGIIDQQELDEDDWRFRFGSYRFRLAKKLPTRFPDVLRQWIDLWQTRYAASADNLGHRTAQLPHMVGSLAVHCPLCDHAIVVRRGLLGTPWEALQV